MAPELLRDRLGLGRSPTDGVKVVVHELGNEATQMRTKLTADHRTQTGGRYRADVVTKRFREGLERNAEIFVATPEEDGCTIITETPSELRHEAGLADARLACDEHRG